MKRILLVVACLLLVSPVSSMAAPVLGGGWDSDQIDAAFTDSVGSPYSYTLSGPAIFSLTDCCVPGDTWAVFGGPGGSGLLAVSSYTVYSPFGAGDPFEWQDPTYQHLQFLLGPGSYTLYLQSDGVGGIPAGVYTRIDNVPEPGTLLLLGSGLVGLGFWRRFKA